MKNNIKAFIYFFVLMLFLIIPTNVYATDNSGNNLKVSDPWEINVSMDVSKEGDLYKASVSTEGMSSADKTSAWNKVFKEYKGIIVGVSGICTLTFVVLFILNFIKLGQSAGNPQARSQALTALLWTGIAAAGCGGFTLFVGFSTNLFRKGFYK